MARTVLMIFDDGDMNMGLKLQRHVTLDLPEH